MSNGNRYGKNQFYNINIAEGEFFSTDRGTYDNPQFLWPADHLRNAVTGRKTKVQRGYMRLVSEVLAEDGSLNSLGKRRFHFQFNPDTLTRSVVARNDVHLWMNQDPAQFTQPIPGDANFAFEIVLNREAEMASGRYKTGQGISDVRRDAAFLGQFGPSGDSIEQLKTAFRERTSDTAVDRFDPSWVTDIGVLADLMVFDQIIGQGINRELIENIINRAEVFTAKARDSAETTSNTDEEDQEPTTPPFDPARAEGFLNGAFGNSAFLISQPVRAVFSSSFMVEGFVTSTNVVFNKFNTAMIPTQCTISVQMQALYIGFARKNTFLTVAYESTPEDLNEYTAELAASNKALTGLGKNMFGTVTDRRAQVQPELFMSTGGGTTQLPVILKEPSEELKTFAKENNGRVIANAVVRIYYTTKSSGYNPPLDQKYAVSSTEPIYQSLSSKEIPLSEINQASINFEFPTQQADYPKRYDQADDARYRFELYIYYTLTSSNGGTLKDSDQYYNVSKPDLKWGDRVPLLRSNITDAERSSTAFSSGGVPEDVLRVV